VIEGAPLPVALVMAVPAGLAKRALVLIVFLMTGIAGRWRILEHGALVATLALDLVVFAPQREVRLGVIESRLCPVALGVAVGAGLPESGLVLVVLPMAGNARRLQLVLIQVSGMAIHAPCLTVPAPQGILGVRVVIKRNPFPFHVDVAALALLAEVRFMLVIFSVASDARRRGVLEPVVLVAVLALDRNVAAAHGKPRLLVVETGLLPVALGVAVGAGRAEVPFVRVILLMAAIALLGSIAMLNVRQVTASALDLRVAMGAPQKEIRLAVIEALLVQLHDPRFAPLVIRMAAPT